MQRFFIVDPSLKDRRGHHYNLTRLATRSAIGAGLEVIWLSSKSAPEGLAAEGARLRPTFSATMYDSYLPGEEKPSLRARLARMFGTKSNGGGAEKVDQAAQFVCDLRAAIHAEKIGANDRLLIHTADGATFIGLPRLMEEIGAARAPIFHVVTPYDPIGVMPNRKSPEDVSAAVSGLKEMGFIDSKAFLYGENAWLARHLSALWSAPVRAQELPMPAPSQAVRARALSWRRDHLKAEDDEFLVVALGAARVEKGFHLFPDIVRETVAQLEEYGEKAKIRFVLHASPQIIGRVGEIEDALKTLEAAPASLVTLLLEPLDDESYENLLLAADAVMLPYQKNEYLHRGSAVVAEAIAAGKALIATEGSYPGRRAAEAGGANASDAAGFAKAAIALAREARGGSASAQEAREAFRRANSVEDYVRKLLRAERGETA